ncbi:hypothetical protein HPB51_023681 [Rhipicephalus microplus]|uniref:Uncharacterized protein n=1 Tax=Rhipicephalus microplus TaxID=6941 RepID=A0A9J6DWT3_RHIMP|nr:hypothetical protein HPB51_023681 [Rhipicephalus microplus]
MDVDEAGTGEATDQRTEQTRSVSTSEDEDADSVTDGWIEVTRKKKRTRTPKQGGEKRTRPFTKPDVPMPLKHCQQGSTSKQDTQTAQNDIKVIVRPRDGLNVRSTCGASLDEAIRNGTGVGDDEMITICPNPTQNILVTSTPEESTATKIAKMKVLTINGKSVTIRVSLYRKQIDFCKECGRLSHRPDVCPRPDIKLCLICGLKNPINGHECTPQCRICGEAHPTADRMCKAKYKVPHVLKQRKWEARFRDFQEQTPSPSYSNAGSPSLRPPAGSRRPPPGSEDGEYGEKNRKLRQELAKARKQNEKSTRKIEELQQTLNEILKRTGGHPTETPSSGASSSVGAADERDTTSAVGDGDTDMGCKGAENHTQEPKRARPAGRKIDVIEEMVDKLTNKTERLFETLLIRLNESDAERNAQYAAVNIQLAAVNKRIEYLEGGTAQLQQQGQGHDELGGDASTILNRSSNVNTTHTKKKGRTDSRVSQCL